MLNCLPQCFDNAVYVSCDDAGGGMSCGVAEYAATVHVCRFACMYVCMYVSKYVCR